MSKMLFRAVAACILVFLSLTSAASGFSCDSVAVKYSGFTKWFSPEKLYLHIDRTYYSAGESVWFMGYLVNASPSSSLPVSRYLYVELLNGEGEVVRRVKVKRDGQGFPGHLDIPEVIGSGYYTLRAYTLWQLNYGPEYFFNQRIRILGTGAEPSPAGQSGGLDVSFYPESGRYFAGMMSSVAFKAMDSLGRSVDFKGWLVENGVNRIASVATRHDGMGSFDFFPKPGAGYEIETETGKRYAVPGPSEAGCTINLKMVGGRLFANVYGVGLSGGTLLLRDNTDILKISEMTFEGKPHLFKFSAISFRPGINHFIVVDDDGKILAERLFFVFDRDDAAPVCGLSCSTVKPGPCALISADVALSDINGRPMDGKFSVSVVRGSFKNYMQDDGIVSYFRLSSELEGHINNPYHYFDSSLPRASRQADMDLLMMVQGWRYYDIPSFVTTERKPFVLRHLKEYWQEIRVRVDRIRGHKSPKKFIFSIIVPKLKINHFVEVMEGSNFVIDSLDFEENTEFLINASRTGLGPGYLPKWNGDVFASGYRYLPAPGNAAEKTSDAEMAVPLVNEFALLDTLSAAVVTAERDTDIAGGFGRTLIGNDLETYKDMTVVEYLKLKVPLFEYNGENMYNRNVAGGIPGVDDSVGDEDDSSETDMSFDFGDAGSGTVKLIVDEFEQSWWGYDMIYLEEVERIDITTQPDPLYGATGGAVYLKLKEGGIRKSFGDRDPSLLYCVPLGYQKPKKFYSPRYDLGEKASAFDSRNTIFWNPSVDVSEGKAVLEFCNTDQMDYPYYVRIEGISAAGIPFSKHCSLDFK